jgi:hypothetical protein
LLEQKVSVSLVVKVIFFLCSILAVWYNAKHQVDSLSEKVIELKEESKTFNIEVIKNDIKYNREHIDRIEGRLK